MTRPELDPSIIGKYINFWKCPRYFKLAFEGKEEKQARAWGEEFESISPLLHMVGGHFEENRWEKLF